MALVLSRRCNERLVILLDGKEVAWITVIESRFDRCQLAFDAPPEVQIYREDYLARHPDPCLRNLARAPYREAHDQKPGNGCS